MQKNVTPADSKPGRVQFRQVVFEKHLLLVIGYWSFSIAAQKQVAGTQTVFQGLRLLDGADRRPHANDREESPRS